MEKYLNVTKSTAQPTQQAGKAEKEKQRPTYKYSPYGVRPEDKKRLNDVNDRAKTAKILLAPLLEKNPNPSSVALRKHILNTISDESNPIAHSDIPQRADYVTSTASGHQRGEGRGRNAQKSYNDFRSKKLAEQLPQKGPPTGGESNVLRNVRVYINGYLKDTTDIEMKRIVALAGGQTSHTPSGATHILTSQQLNGSKTHKLLTSKSKKKPYVVRPEWITDSTKAGKRLPERTYSVIANNATRDLTSMMVAAGSSREAPIELD